MLAVVRSHLMGFFKEKSYLVDLNNLTLFRGQLSHLFYSCEYGRTFLEFSSELWNIHITDFEVFLWALSQISSVVVVRLENFVFFLDLAGPCLIIIHCIFVFY